MGFNSAFKGLIEQFKTTFSKVSVGYNILAQFCSFVLQGLKLFFFFNFLSSFAVSVFWIVLSTCPLDHYDIGEFDIQWTVHRDISL